MYFAIDICGEGVFTMDDVSADSRSVDMVCPPGAVDDSTIKISNGTRLLVLRILRYIIQTIRPIYRHRPIS